MDISEEAYRKALKYFEVMKGDILRFHEEFSSSIFEPLC